MIKTCNKHIGNVAKNVSSGKGVVRRQFEISVEKDTVITEVRFGT